MKRGFVAIVVLCAVLLSLPPARAETWHAFQRAHRSWIHRDKPAHDLLGLTPAWIQARADWRAEVRLRTARWYHRWLRAAAPFTVPAIESGPPGVLTYNGDHEAMWLCIHSYEGSWTDPDPPYFGGLQMGYGFMEAYGGSLYAEKGTADHWTPDEQIGVAEAAFAINGYNLNWLWSQWPISGPACT
jgi:hypothetical protein